MRCTCAGDCNLYTCVGNLVCVKCIVVIENYDGLNYNLHWNPSKQTLPLNPRMDR
jgi:hypothetical protein